MSPEERLIHFDRGLTLIAEATRQEISSLTREVYASSLCDEVDPRRWEEFVRWALKANRFPQWFPKLAELRDAYYEFLGGTPLELAASKAYDRVLDSADYNINGTYWNRHTIRAECGNVAEEAFIAAGGHEAFATTYRADDRRRAFINAYVRAAREIRAAPELNAAGEVPSLS